jgi:hypothetical protein
MVKKSGVGGNTVKKIFSCRRTFITFIGIVALLSLGLINGIDTSMAIATAVGAICGANSWEARSKNGK